MRPIASEQDPLRHPLNELFGTRSRLRQAAGLQSSVADKRNREVFEITAGQERC